MGPESKEIFSQFSVSMPIPCSWSYPKEMTVISDPGSSLAAVHRLEKIFSKMTLSDTGRCDNGGRGSQGIGDRPRA